MNIWFAVSEAMPLVKTGGLADVAGSLPKALAKRGIAVTVVMPRYGAIPDEYTDKAVQRDSFHIAMGWRCQYCAVHELSIDGIRFLLIDNEYYFRRGTLYGYGDEAERFVFFSIAVAELAVRADQGELPDLIHCHDWQTGLIPFLLRTRYSYSPAIRRVRTVFTIHNLRYQGIFPRELMQDLLGAGEELFTESGIEFYGSASCMKAGIRYADKLTTVSPTYAKEIQTEQYGERLEGLLRLRAGAGDLHGILNGIDTESYDPMNDPHIAAPYGDGYGKKTNKPALQLELGLPCSPETPMIGMVSRLVDQKGIDLLIEALPELMDEQVQLAVAGCGDSALEDLLRDAAMRYPDRLAVRFGFNEGLARRIYAGSDLFLMPSRFEPCGLSQLIALRYGSVPIVRETGGLLDTVEPFQERTGQGFGFRFAQVHAKELVNAVRQALTLYRRDAVWERIVRNGMEQDYGWGESARQYDRLYRGMCGAPA